jgi:hypothetical protein
MACGQASEERKWAPLGLVHVSLKNLPVFSTE